MDAKPQGRPQGKPEGNGDDRPSKSARKRAAVAVRELADRLVALKPQVLDGLPLDPDVRTAIDAARDINSHGAKRRQKQYIARLLRESDLAPLHAAIAALDSADRSERRRLHRTEALRDALLAGRAAEELPEAVPEHISKAADRLVARHQQGQDDRQRKRAARELFRLLHDSLNEQGHTGSNE